VYSIESARERADNKTRRLRDEKAIEGRWGLEEGKSYARLLAKFKLLRLTIQGKMARQSGQDVTQLLRAWSKGDQTALERLTPLVYEELHKAARSYMSRESPEHILQTTALINEVYVRLVDLPEIEWQDRAHFFAVCARIMRHILTDFARSSSCQKRGGDARRITLDEALAVTPDAPTNLLVLEEALSKLEKLDSRKSSVVELRFFGGLTVKETAEVLRVSSETIMRDWNLARAWLLREMDEGPRHDA